MVITDEFIFIRKDNVIELPVLRGGYNVKHYSIITLLVIELPVLRGGYNLLTSITSSYKVIELPVLRGGYNSSDIFKCNFKL